MYDRYNITNSSSKSINVTIIAEALPIMQYLQRLIDPNKSDEVNYGFALNKSAYPKIPPIAAVIDQNKLLLRIDL